MQCALVIDCRLNLSSENPTKKSRRFRLASLSDCFRTLSCKLNTTIRQRYRSSCDQSSHTGRGTWSFIWSSCLDVAWRWASQIIIFHFFFLSLAVYAHDDPSVFHFACEDVQTYYDGVDHLSGEALKLKLNSIVAKHKVLSYNKVWDALKLLDAADIDRPEASSGIVEIYSLRVVPKQLAGKPDGWNREHLWPRSFGLTKGPSLSDLHNIRPADVNVNSSRGNKYYGECHDNSADCRKPATEEAAPDTETDNKRWAPPQQVRGDIARALMYMAVSYGFNQSDGSLDLCLSDSPSVANKEMGLLTTLLKWNEVDPPSREEKLRNERICKLYQHNRNPFVDHPEYAKLIWKQGVSSHQGAYSPLRKAWVNELHYYSKGRDRNDID